eukprot:3949497-Amphidinium_carterae.1
MGGRNTPSTRYKSRNAHSHSHSLTHRHSDGHGLVGVPDMGSALAAWAFLKLSIGTIHIHRTIRSHLPLWDQPGSKQARDNKTVTPALNYK